ncbi:MAG TPA: methyltransferase domain-containing protein [Candidatus Polarisedimenticolia bacterium]|nr:methyltransferase domain-containing protein [Candidatus Polarisedimenticolia bacterium]
MSDADRRRDDLVVRLLEANLATYDLAAIHLGDRLGLYQALAGGDPSTPGELADRTGTRERYVREWLEQQAVTGILEVEDAERPAGERRYRIPAGHDEVLLDRDSLSYISPLGRFSLGVLTGLPRLMQAFREGGGVPYTEYGRDAREGQAEMNRTMFINLLGSQWIPALPDVDARLRADPPARVADLACGTGWSSISLAKAYPKARITGIDSDEASIDLARRNVAAEGLAGRVGFQMGDASEGSLEGRFDLVTIFEALHDMARPVDALRQARAMLAEGGAVVVADERVDPAFSAPNPRERLYYSWSVLFCLPTGMAEQPSAGTGAVMRPDTLRAYASEAGFRGVQALPIENDFWRFYRLEP